MDRELRLEVHRRYPTASIHHGHSCPAMDRGKCDYGADEELAPMETARDGFIAGWKAAMSSLAKV